MNEDYFKYTQFLITLLDLANKHIFKISVDDNNIEILYPNRNSEQSIKLFSMDDFGMVCTDILRWN